MSELPEIFSQINGAGYAESADQVKLLRKLPAAYGFNGRDRPVDHYQYNKQVHGTNIIKAAVGRANATVDADGIWTDEPGLTIAVRTADCLPVLLADRARSMVMAVHAGWRGLTAGILAEALKTFAVEGIAGENIVAVIGPAISREHYEVGPEVVEALFSPACGLSQAAAGLCVAKGRTDRWHLDLQAAAVLSLTTRGIPAKQVEVLQICTYSSLEYNSYRREGKGVASNISWISL